MATTETINVDIAQVFDQPEKGKVIRTMAWGDAVKVLKTTLKHVEIEVINFIQHDDGFEPVKSSGFIRPKGNMSPKSLTLPKSQDKVLRFNFVDVQQGDGSVIETAKGKVILIDGGDNVMFARYLAARFRGTSLKKPQPIECILVTHGDADHFLGLTEISKSEELAAKWKRLFIQPKRVYHNGLVKRPSANGKKKRKETEMLGATKTVKDPVTQKELLIVTELESNLLKVDDAKMNVPFLAWKKALQAYNKRGKKAIEFRHLQQGDDDAFDFLKDENIKVEVLGPIPTKLNGVEGLKFLGNPPKGPRIGHESLNLDEAGFSGKSSSHTINGHSIVFRLTYGGFNFLFTGDLNDEAARKLTLSHNKGEVNLQAEVFKVPHHGSADFSGALLQAVAPVVSIISSGDESARKEFIHPRATIVGALGRHSRLEEPLIFVTELVAFFQFEDMVSPEFHKLDKKGICQIKDNVALLNEKARKAFFAFSRTAYGIVKMRTDGKRLLVFTDSGQSDLKEAYAYEVDDKGKIAPAEVSRA